MKLFIYVAASVLLIASADAQTVVTVTNIGPPNYRVVSNKVYVVEKSPLWADVKATCLEVVTNGVLAKTDPPPPPRNRSPVRYGNFIGEGFSAPDPKTIKRPAVPQDVQILIRNYPANLPVSSGERISQLMMPVGLGTNAAGERIRVYDFGVRYTNVVTKTNASRAK